MKVFPSLLLKRLALSALLLLCLPLHIAPGVAYEDLWPKCDTCLADSVREAAGVGFELTTSYATASVRYYNGSTLDVALAPASKAYVERLTHLSQSTVTPTRSRLQQLLRRLNKLLGRPATTNVGIISELLSSLRGEVESQLNHQLDRVVVTTPQFPALTREDVEDAIQYTGLRSWLEYPLPYPAMLYSSNAAFVASGQGLCKELDNLYACMEEVEDGDVPRETVFAVTFTNVMLHTTVSRISYAFSSLGSDIRLAAPQLGLLMLPIYSQSAYWAGVRDHLQTLPQEAARRGHPITAVVLLGENAAMQEFLTILRDALSEIGITPEPIIYRENALENDKSENVDWDRGKTSTARLKVADPLWAAARGAALYAQLRQRFPWNCTERKECRNHAESGASETAQQVIWENGEL